MFIWRIALLAVRHCTLGLTAQVHVCYALGGCTPSQVSALRLGSQQAPPWVIADLVVPDRCVNIHASHSLFQLPTKHRGDIAPASK